MFTRLANLAIRNSKNFHSGLLNFRNASVIQPPNKQQQLYSTYFNSNNNNNNRLESFKRAFATTTTTAENVEVKKQQEQQQQQSPPSQQQNSSSVSTQHQQQQQHQQKQHQRQMQRGRNAAAAAAASRRNPYFYPRGLDDWFFRRWDRDLIDPFFLDSDDLLFADQDFFPSSLTASPTSSSSSAASSTSSSSLWLPNADVSETEKNFELSLEVPGFEKKDIELSVNEQNRELHVRGTRQSTKEETEKTYKRKERFSSSFHRCFLLPDNVNTEKIQAKLLNGVLHVNIEKTTEKKAERRVVQLQE